METRRRETSSTTVARDSKKLVKTTLAVLLILSLFFITFSLVLYAVKWYFVSKIHEEYVGKSSLATQRAIYDRTTVNYNTGAVRNSTVVSSQRSTTRKVVTSEGAATEPEEKEFPGWGRNISRETTNYVDPFNDTTIISGEEICKKRNATIVIICTSRPWNFLNRKAIRETWASYSKSLVVGFLLGFDPDPKIQFYVEQESQLFGDIIQENFLDSYWNLTIKSISLLKWYIRWCPTVSLLMKADDDTFMDVRLLERKLLHYRPFGYINGYLNGDACRSVSREGSAFYYMPYYLYPEKFYPDYVGGPAYFMSRDVAEKLYAAALQTPVFPIEDIYITGICARKANVTIKHFEWASFWMHSGPKDQAFRRKCLRHHIFCHPVRPTEMVALWTGGT